MGKHACWPVCVYMCDVHVCMCVHMHMGEDACLHKTLVALLGPGGGQGS